MPELIVPVNLETDVEIDVDIGETFMHMHQTVAGVVLPAGGLPVRDGHLVVAVCRNKLHKIFPKRCRYAGRDTHPLGHDSLLSSYVWTPPGGRPLELADVLGWTDADNPIISKLFSYGDLRDYLEQMEKRNRGGGKQMLWPDHGIIGTRGAHLHPDLDEDQYCFVQDKGFDPCCDSYSAFRDNLGRPTGLADRLHQAGVKRVFVTGLALDFCAGWTAIDGVEEGFEVYLVVDATRPVDLPGGPTVAGSMTNRFYQMVAAGVRFVVADQLRLMTKPF
jgi:nicotinamidase-related amidase